MKPSPSRAHRSRRGLTLVEMLIVMTILTIALGEVTRSMLTISRLEPMSREADLALQAAATQLDTMRALPFDTLVARYNADPADDPPTGASPGSGFDVPGLRPVAGDADGFVGEITFPTDMAPLREDVQNELLCMPRDLNGDKVIDGEDHSLDYVVLPVTVSVRWRGRAGVREFQLHTMLAQLEKAE